MSFVDAHIVEHSEILKELSLLEPVTMSIANLSEETHELLLKYVSLPSDKLSTYPLPQCFWDESFLSTISFLMISSKILEIDCIMYGNAEKIELLKTHQLKNITFTLFDSSDNWCDISAKHGHLDCLKLSYKKIKCLLDARAAENGYLNCLKYAHKNEYLWNQTTCANAAENGHLNCLKYAHKNGCPWTQTTCANAAENGHLNCLKYAHKNGCSWNQTTCAKAAKNGHLNCLKYAHKNGCRWDKKTCAKAAKHGHLDCLKYARENGCPWDKSTCDKAITYGHLDCLKYAQRNGCPCDKSSVVLAVKTGNLKCFKYLHPIYHVECSLVRIYRLSEIIKDATTKKKVKCLKYALEQWIKTCHHDEDEICKFDYYHLFQSGMKDKNLTCLKYIIKTHGCPWKFYGGDYYVTREPKSLLLADIVYQYKDWDDYYGDKRISNLDDQTDTVQCIKYLYKNVPQCKEIMDEYLYDIAVKSANLKIMKLAKKYFPADKPPDRLLSTYSVSLNNTFCYSIINYECVKRAYKDGGGNYTGEYIGNVVLDIIAFGPAENQGAASNNLYNGVAHDTQKLKCIKYITKNVSPTDESFLKISEKFCDYAAGYDLPKCLKYFHTKGYAWSRTTCARAARYNNIKCLKYAHENGCLWDEFTCYKAVQGGALECLKYAHENGCPWDKTIYNTMEYYSCDSMNHYIDEQDEKCNKSCCMINDWCVRPSDKNIRKCLKYATRNNCPR